MSEVTLCSGANWCWGRGGWNCTHAVLAGMAVIPEYSQSVLGSKSSQIDLQVLPLVGYCASRWIIPGGWRDRIFLSLLLQGVDSHVLLRQPLLYCHFAHGGRDPCYLPVRDWNVLKTVLTDALDNYNELNAAMPLVLFEDAMQHVWVDKSWCFFTVKVARSPQSSCFCGSYWAVRAGSSCVLFVILCKTARVSLCYILTLIMSEASTLLSEASSQPWFHFISLQLWEVRILRKRQACDSLKL